MKLTLQYDPPVSDLKIGHRHKLMLAGSCFAENIGKLLQEHFFSCVINPGGILFDAVSLARFFLDVMRNEPRDASYLVERGGTFFSFLHHSAISGSSAAEMEALQTRIRGETKSALGESDFLIISLGTAFTYYHGERGFPVANCHKQPGSLFSRKLAATDDVIRLYSELLKEFHKVNPRLHVIFTVSPVKYLKDGPVSNNLSKSTLLLAVNGIVNANTNCSYFPAYELIIDDLRDYRFYKEDLSHPNHIAIQYVWEKFTATWFSAETQKVNSEIAKLNSALSHKPLHAHPAELEKLNKHINQKKQLIMKLEPAIKHLA